MKKYFRKFSGLLIAVLLLAGVGTLASSDAQAQGRNRPARRVIIVRRPFYRPFFYDPFWSPYSRLDHFRYSQYVFSDSEKAYSEGYQDGVKVGRGDAKNRRTYKPERSHYFYEAGFGNFGEVYRRGFSQGYAAGWQS